MLFVARIAGLSPGTRYFVRPAQGSVQGPESTFVTAQAPGVNATVRFAAIADQWISSAGSLGTTERLVARIAEAPRDVEFVIHVGDLGYGRYQ